MIDSLFKLQSIIQNQSLNADKHKILQIHSRCTWQGQNDLKEHWKTCDKQILTNHIA